MISQVKKIHTLGILFRWDHSRDVNILRYYVWSLSEGKAVWYCIMPLPLALASALQ